MGILGCMDKIISAFNDAKSRYDSGVPSPDACFSVVAASLDELQTRAKIIRYGDFSGPPRVQYSVAKSAANLSRPFRPELFVSSIKDFRKLALSFDDLLHSNDDTTGEDLTKLIYTCVTSVSLSYDLWKPKSRKTPGTFFEVLVGTIASLRYPKFKISKHIPIIIPEVSSSADAVENDSGEVSVDIEADEADAVSGNSVSTDLVITNPKNGRGAVIPLKITTRERIVQPFAHQRILDSAYPGKFSSFIACISEVQRDDKTSSVKQICVPGTVALFQKHLSKASGLYYCDIPQRYAKDDFQKLIPVRSFHRLFGDIDAWLK